MGRINLKLLQSFSCFIDDRADHRVSSPRLHALLAWLVLRRNGPQPRELLASALWPDSPDIQARTNLRNLLHRLRAVSPELEAQIDAGEGTLQWRTSTDCAVDLVMFEEAADRSELPDRLKAALELYTGPLLAGYRDEWLEPERQRLSRMYEHLLTRAITHYEQSREVEAAIDAARRLLECNPLQEEAYRALMRLHAMSGDRAAALKVYRQCVETLEHELGVFPSDPTRDIAKRLRQETLSTPRPATATADLVGRKAEWAQLQSLWRRATDGGLYVAALEGEAGTGKSRLAEEMRVWARRQSIPVSFAKCFPTERQLSYGATISLLKTCPLESLPEVWGLELYPLFPERLKARHRPARDGLEPYMRYRLFEAISRALCVQQPRLVVIDDVQWCDPDSIDWLASLASSESDVRVLVLLTICTEELAPDHPLKNLLHALRRAERLVKIPVGPLNREESLQLIAQTSAHLMEAEVARWVLEQGAGNPLMLIEILRAGVPDLADLSRARLPTSIQALFERKLARLSPAARTVAELASVMGDTCSISRLEALTAIDATALIDGTEELWGRGVLLDDGQGQLLFSHGLFADFVYRQMSALRRRSRHLQVAESLEGQTLKNLSEWVELSRHLELGGRQEQAASAFVSAGEHAIEVHGYEQARRYFSYALTLLSAGSPIEVRWAALAGLELANQPCGRLEEHADTLAAMLALAEAHGREDWLADTGVRMCRQLRLQGDPSSARIHAERAIRHAANARSLSLEATACIERALVLLHDDGGFQQSMDSLARAYHLASELGHRPMQGRARTISALCLVGFGRIEDADQCIQEALAILRSGGDDRGIAQTLLHLSRISQLRGHWEDAWRALEEAKVLTTACGQTTILIPVLAEMGLIATRQRRFFQALDYLKEATRLLRPYPYESMRVEHCMYAAAPLVALGEPTLAIRMLEQARPFLSGAQRGYQLARFSLEIAGTLAVFGHWDELTRLIETSFPLPADPRDQAHRFCEGSEDALKVLLRVREGSVEGSIAEFANALKRVSPWERSLDQRDLYATLLDCLESREAFDLATELALKLVPGLESDLTGMLRPHHACFLAGRALERAGRHEEGRRLLDRHLELAGELARHRQSRSLADEIQEVSATLPGPRALKAETGRRLHVDR